jgi:hypothetical protein
MFDGGKPWGSFKPISTDRHRSCGTGAKSGKPWRCSSSIIRKHYQERNMDINGLNGSSSQYQNTMQDAPDVGKESGGESPQLQSNQSPFGGAGTEASTENIGQMMQMLQSLLRNVFTALQKLQSLETSQSHSPGAPSGAPGHEDTSPQTPSGSPNAGGSDDAKQSPPTPPTTSPSTSDKDAADDKDPSPQTPPPTPPTTQGTGAPGGGSQPPTVQPQAPGTQDPGKLGQQPPPQSSVPPSGGSESEGGAGGAGGQDQGSLIKVAQILQGLLGSLLGAIPFLGSALSALTTRIGSSAQNH